MDLIGIGINDHSGKNVIKLVEKLLINTVTELFQIMQSIQDYLLNKYGKTISFIAYAADQVK